MFVGRNTARLIKISVPNNWQATRNYVPPRIDKAEREIWRDTVGIDYPEAKYCKIRIGVL